MKFLPSRTRFRADGFARNLMMLALIGGLSLAQSCLADIAGSVDPLGIERFPHSTIVGYKQDDVYLIREFAIGRVDKTRRDIRVEREVRPSATRQWATYESRAGTKPEEVVSHYLALLGSGAAFTCRGRDCGRSNQWANDIFGQALLYGPDKNQFYLAGEYQQHLVALYVIERGNKRVYAHLEVLKPETPVVLGGNAEVVQRLAGEGLSLIDGVTPARDGSLPTESQSVFTDLAADLSIFAGQTIYVVCHLYGPEATDLLLERSGYCAEYAAAALRSERGPIFQAFAAGPLLPRAAGAQSRLELVLPHRLRRD